LQIWDSKIDLPQIDGTPVNKDIPCNVMSIPKIRDGKLEWLQIIRSNDFLLGVQHNFVQFTCIQEIMAGWLGFECGSYNQISDSLHEYTHDEADILSSTPLAQVITNTDSLALPKTKSELLWEELGRRIELMIDPELKQGKIEHYLRWDAPQAYQNILAVLVAEAARRHKWMDTAAGAMSTCNNPVYQEMWKHWCLRMSLPR
jgi:thymidylate synthase